MKNLRKIIFAALLGLVVFSTTGCSATDIIASMARGYTWDNVNGRAEFDKQVLQQQIFISHQIITKKLGIDWSKYSEAEKQQIEASIEQEVRANEVPIVFEKHFSFKKFLLWVLIRVLAMPIILFVFVGIIANTRLDNQLWPLALGGIGLYIFQFIKGQLVYFILIEYVIVCVMNLVLALREKKYKYCGPEFEKRVYIYVLGYLGLLIISYIWVLKGFNGAFYGFIGLPLAGVVVFILDMCISSKKFLKEDQEVRQYVAREKAAKEKKAEAERKSFEVAELARKAAEEKARQEAAEKAAKEAEAKAAAEKAAEKEYQDKVVAEYEAACDEASEIEDKIAAITGKDAASIMEKAKLTKKFNELDKKIGELGDLMGTF